MKKRWILALTMLVCLCVLTACQSSEPQRFDVKSADNQQTSQTNQNTEDPAADEGYDPTTEEDYYQQDLSVETPEPVATATPTVAPTVRSEYAGATPVPIDPIDKPTPTPVPPLSFTYQVYDATKLGLSFEAPVGWTVEDTASDTYILQNPNAQVDYPATLTLRAIKVNTDYSTSALEDYIESMLDSIGTAGFEDYNPSNTASRDLITGKGVYANYTGTLNDGRQIAGRVHATCIDKVLYTVHITYPKAYTETYKELVYDHLRDTIKITH
ncbi:MAG: hypothetical protein IJ438_11700 [Clostridia bacterium]|nr:hypothetical protein [Clostridia bacterium]